jgi:superfamily II DNA/RNA helicase
MRPTLRSSKRKIEQTEETVVDQATAAHTIPELEAEIAILCNLENLALSVRRSGTDKKWEELSSLLQNHAEMFDAHGHRRKMVLFTEHRDALNYLAERLRALLGTPKALVTVHGGMGREDRTKAQEAFKQDKDVLILLATDASGEGTNLQQAHPVLLADVGGEPSEAAVIREHCAPDRGAAGRKRVETDFHSKRMDGRRGGG